jgi:hypothetical protein
MLFVRSVEAETAFSGWHLNCPGLFRTSCRAVANAFSQRIIERFKGTWFFAPKADGGGDGGGDGGDGSGGDGGAGDSGGGGGGDSGDGDGNGDDTGAVGDQGDQGNSDNAVSNDPSAVSDQTTDPSNENAVLSPTAPTSTVDVAQTAPNFGPGAPGGNAESPGSRIVPGLGQPPGGPAVGAPPSDVGINALIVSGAPTPWEAIGKVASVRNVIVTGGIVALGETPLDNLDPQVSASAANNPPAWLRFKPDLRYLNGSVFPPVIPNVIDIRTLSYSEEAINNPQN